MNSQPSSVADLKGSCLCGASTYTISDPTPLYSVICHCIACQQWSGSVFAANIGFALSAFHVDEKSWESIKIHDDTGPQSGRTLHRHFCGKCGSCLFVTSASMPGFVSVMRGCLEGNVNEVGELSRKEFDPKNEFFCERRVDWVQVEGIVDSRKRMDKEQ